jgi:non-specific serine/threonine protein kinase
MTSHQSLQNVPGMAQCLIGFAAIALKRGLPAEGARLLGAADTIGGPRKAAASMWHASQLEYEQNLDLARAKLTEAAFLAAQEAGRAMSLTQALVYAQNLPRPVESFQDGLTSREREVAALIGQGMSNSEIAAELVLSKRTVETHVGNILSKLELAGRGQVMLWAINRGISQTPQ